MHTKNAQETHKIEVTKRLESLIEYIDRMESTEQRRTLIIFCIINLLQQSCDVIESLGVLEIIKDMLIMPINTKENINKLKIPWLFYIT